MEIHKSPLYADVQAVLDATQARPWYVYSAQVRLPNGELLQAIKVVNMDISENYAQDYCAIQSIKLLYGLGTFVKQIYQNRLDLEVLVTRLRRDGDNTEEVVSTYRALLLLEEAVDVDVTQMSDSEQFALDVASLYEANFQLVDRTIDQLRTIAVGGVYRKTNVGSILQTLLTTASASVDADAEFQLQGVQLEPGYNEREFEQLVLPHGTALFDAPGFIQEKAGGIYPTGLGHFVRDQTWFIYPLYDTERYDSNSNARLEITVVPQALFESLDKTSTQYGSVTLIIAAGDRANERETEDVQQNEGEGVRFTDARTLLEGFVDTQEENKAKISRGSNVNEFLTEASKSGFDNAPMSNNAITENSMRELSKLAALKGTYFSCVWNHSDFTILQPGMLARIKFLDGTQIRIVEGVLVGAVTAVQLYGTGITANSHYHSTALTFFVQRELNA